MPERSPTAQALDPLVRVELLTLLMSCSLSHTHRSFLDSFGVPYTLVLGNHDLEGEEFETDRE
jgi:hypothetical protein